MMRSIKIVLSKILQNSLQASTSNFIKNDALAQMFSYEFYEILKNTFLQNTSGRLLMIISFLLNPRRSPS